MIVTDVAVGEGVEIIGDKVPIYTGKNNVN